MEASMIKHADDLPDGLVELTDVELDVVCGGLQQQPQLPPALLKLEAEVEVFAKWLLSLAAPKKMSA
jgi:hypothetical protein